MPSDSSASSEFPERFGRNVDLFGAEGFARIRRARVAVIGLGGVGSHAALALARSGVGRLLLADFDLVTASSLNRNPVAGPADVGRTKLEVLAEHLARTCPDTVCEQQPVFCHEDTIGQLLSPVPDCIIDAIDSLNPKVVLLEHCLRNGLSVISSMGASSRVDATKLRVGDISETSICPLARKIRTRLKRRGLERGLTCVWSVESPAPPLPPDLGDRTCDRGRTRNRLPSQISLPGVFGYTVAILALQRLAGAVR